MLIFKRVNYHFGAFMKATPEMIEAAPELLDALKTIMRMDVKGHQLQDRLQFSDAGRDILNKALSAIDKAESRS